MEYMDETTLAHKHTSVADCVPDHFYHCAGLVHSVYLS